MNKWYYHDGEENDVVVSSRIRLARNVDDLPFPNKMTMAQKKELMRRVVSVFFAENSPLKDDYIFIDMSKISQLEAYSMAERHLISPDLAQNTAGRGLILSKDESVSIMLNEEDHIRIQVLTVGLELETAYKCAQQIDEFLEKNFNFAFDKNLGYLTECPTNLGTGMRASVMMHIPALESADAIGQLANTISRVGLTIRGTFGEGSEIKCAMYQISNQITLGISEQNAIENLQGIVRQIIDRERQARDSIDRERLEDAVYRSLGLLANARFLTSSEFLDLISKVRLGVGMKMIDRCSMKTIDELIFCCQPSSLQFSAGHELDADSRDRMRANIVREKIG